MIKIREIAQGKGKYILQSMGFPIEYMGKKHRDCPLCKAGRDRWRFTDYKGNGGFICSTCTPEGGDFIKLAMEYFGYSFIEVVKITKNILGIEDKKMNWQPTSNNALAYQEQKKAEAERQKNRSFIDSKEREFLNVTQGDPVSLYLQSRGISIIPPTIRYHPAYFQDGTNHPCLVARMDNGSLDDDSRCYQRVTWKQIFLTSDGKKANVTAVKKCMPIERDFNGCSIKLFDYYAQSGRLAVCEGIEKALQHYEQTKIPTWSLDNAGNMAKWDCPKTVRELIIVSDMDAGFKGQAAAYELAEKASRLKGKAGYQLESVSVKLFLRFQADWEEIIDNGVKADYEDYYLCFD